MGSQLVAVRAGLIAALAALPALADFETTYIPKKGSKARSRCFTDRARITHEPAGLRPVKTFRNEDATFDLVLYTEGAGAAADPVVLSESLAVAGTAVENFIAVKANWGNNALGTTGLNWLLVKGEGGFAEGWTDNGLAVSVTYPIAYNARLT